MQYIKKSLILMPWPLFIIFIISLMWTDASSANQLGTTIYFGEVTIESSGGVTLKENNDILKDHMIGRLFGIRITDYKLAENIVSGNKYKCRPVGSVNIIANKQRIPLLICNDSSDLGETLINMGVAEEDCVESNSKYGSCK